MKMKKYLMTFVVGASLFTSMAHAGCEDGANIAEQAVHSLIHQKFPMVDMNLCAASADENSMQETATGEIWTVTFACTTGLASKYEVQLIELEDAVCTAQAPHSIAIGK
jgi:hypothetical protein